MAGSSREVIPDLMRTMARVVFCVLFALCSALVISPQSATAAREIIQWDTHADGWSGTGSVYIPGRGRAETPSSAAGSDCAGCSWVVVVGCPGPVAGGRCGPECATDETLINSWHVNPAVPVGEQITSFSISCAGPGQRPLTEEEMGRIVADAVRQAAPKLGVSFQPPGGAITQLPTIFSTGQPKVLDRTDNLAGFSVHFTAHPTWTWTWGDGKSTTTSDPGGVYPDMSVTHTYRHPGTVRVSVSVAWQAEFSVNGGQTVSPDGATVTQNATVPIKIREARAELVAQ